MRRSLFALMLLVLGPGSGCSGELPPILKPSQDSGPLVFDQGGQSFPDQWVPPKTDLGTAKKDGAPATGDGAVTADKGTPKPDVGAPKTDVGVGVGGPCPCVGGAQCIENVCRGTCAAPTDACGVDSVCPAAHGCVKSASNVYVCIPASPAGTPCPAGANPPVRCATKHVCGSVNGSAFQCLPTCAVNADCHNGFCAPTSTACKICSLP